MAGPQEPGQTPAGWYADPSDQARQRYWDGTSWTEQVSGGGAGQGGGDSASSSGQIRFTSTLGGNYLATFDGVVLEVFGAEAGVGATSQRFHRDHMTITIEEPDRKGTRKVWVHSGPSWSRAVPSGLFRIAEQDRAVIAFFESVRAALPSV
jgi:Protein of unknown function (DUF2510)